MIYYNLSKTQLEAIADKLNYECPFVNDVRLKKRKIFCQKEERSDE